MIKRNGLSRILHEEERFKRAFTLIDNNTPSKINKKQLQASINNRKFILTNVKVKDYIFNTSFNREGKHISFNTGCEVLKFYVPINLFSLEDKQELLQNRVSNLSTVNTIRNKRLVELGNDLISNYDRGLKNRNSIEVYVNGLKIPDEEILLTIVDGTTDVYFESKYLTEEENEIIFMIKKNTADKPYSNYTFTGDKNILSGLDTLEITNGNFINVYLNGSYQIHKKDYLIKDNKIVFNKSFDSNDVLEILKLNYNNYCEEYLTSFYTPIISIENFENEKGEKLSLWNKVISKDILEVYIDGRRLNNNLIDDLSATYFLLKYDFTKERDVFIRVNLQDEDLRVDYLDAYNKATNFFKKSITIDSLSGKTINKNIPEYFTTKNLNEQFSPKYLGNYINDPLNLSTSKYEYYLTMLKNYVQTNSYYIKHIAKQFVEEREVYTKTYSSNYLDYFRNNTSQEFAKNVQYFNKVMCLFSFNAMYDMSIPYIEKIFVDGRFLIPNKDYIIKTNNTNMFFIYIDASYIKEGTVVECEMERSLNIGRTSHKYEFKGHVNELTHFFSLNEFNIFKEDIDNLCLSCKYPGSDHAILMSKDNYKLDISMVEGEEMIRIKIKDGILPTNTELDLFNPLFVDRKIHVIEESYNNEENAIIKLKNIYPDIMDNPFITSEKTKDNIEVYLNNTRIFEGINYRFILPGNDNNFKEPVLLLSISTKIGDAITIINKENKTSVIESFDKINSRYGLVYLSNIKQPFSTEYMSVYLNGIKLKDSNIKFIANNVVLLKNISSIHNLVFISHIDMNNDLEEQLYNISLLNKDSFEKYLERFIYDNNTSLDDAYNDLTPNPSDDELDIPESDGNIFDKTDVPLNILIQSFMDGTIDRRVDSNNDIPEEDINNHPFFEYFFDEVVPLDSNENVIYIEDPTPTEMEEIKNSISLDASENYYSIQEVSRLFLEHEIRKQREIIDGDLDSFDDSNIGKYIYIENPIILNTNEEVLDEQFVMDASEETDELMIFDANSF